MGMKCCREVAVPWKWLCFFYRSSEYLKEKKEEEEILAELAKKYRDRAKERRDGGETSGPDAMTTLGAYRAVAPDIKT